MGNNAVEEVFVLTALLGEDKVSVLNITERLQV